MGWIDEQKAAYRGRGQNAPPPVAGGTSADSSAGTVDKGPAWTQGPSAYGGDYRRWFMDLVKGFGPNSDRLKQLGPILEKYGVKLRPNAAGIFHKIELPNGQVVRVGDQFDGREGSTKGWTWVTGGGDAAGVGGAADGSAVAPWTEGFTPPNVTDDPGYQWRLNQGLQAVERSAASKGTLLTGGTLKDLTNYAQGAASQEYGQAYGRSRSEYDLRRDIFESNQDRPWMKLRDLANTGRPQ